MKQLQNQMRLAAQLAGQGDAHTRFGLVTGYDGFSCATVRLEPEGADTGWLPIKSLQVGSGWGIVAAPNIGDVASVEFQEGDNSAGMITGFYFNDGARSPNVPAGEFWVVREDGGSLKFHNDGSVELHVTGNLTATVSGTLNAEVTGAASISASNWEIHGPVHFADAVTGDSTADFDGDVHGNGTSLHGHQHDVVGIQPGSATKRSNPPA